MLPTPDGRNEIVKTCNDYGQWMGSDEHICYSKITFRHSQTKSFAAVYGIDFHSVALNFI